MTRFTAHNGVLAMALFVLVGAVLAGCQGRPAIFSNPDPLLRKNATAFAADSAKRFPYKADAPKGGDATARAQVEYGFKCLEVVNQSTDDWTDVEVWVNQSYVCFLPRMEHGVLKRIEFPMLYNANGEHFPTNNSTIRIEKVEILRDGKLFTVSRQLSE